MNLLLDIFVRLIKAHYSIRGGKEKNMSTGPPRTVCSYSLDKAALPLGTLLKLVKLQCKPQFNTILTTLLVYSNKYQY